ncbi:MAG TPA: hypothetical protein VFH61_18220, partial [Thermoleophilia bacterium]|nr:hypothetical protein [Thermoleophilia bacterium]
MSEEERTALVERGEANEASGEILVASFRDDSRVAVLQRRIAWCEAFIMRLEALSDPNEILAACDDMEREAPDRCSS